MKVLIPTQNGVPSQESISKPKFDKEWSFPTHSVLIRPMNSAAVRRVEDLYKKKGETLTIYTNVPNGPPTNREIITILVRYSKEIYKDMLEAPGVEIQLYRASASDSLILLQESDIEALCAERS